MAIDLRSDTVTRPTAEMKEEMMKARVGDDVFGDDETVIELENLGASLFGKEAAVYCPSGTMANQIAINVHTSAPGEVICDELSHIYNYEGGGIGFNSGLATKLLAGNKGRLNANQVKLAINPDNVHFPETQLVCLENTCNKGGGTIYNLEEIKRIRSVCSEEGLKLHLDGARIFNAIVESNYTALEIGREFDTISICLSKGLGAPIGSLLIGKPSEIKKARRIRKVLGGGMRQVGYLAAAGIYALKHNINRLTEDHRRAKKLAEVLSSLSYVKHVSPVYTNIVIFEVASQINSKEVINKLNHSGILVVGFGPQKIRMVTHLDFQDAELESVIHTLSNLNF